VRELKAVDSSETYCEKCNVSNLALQKKINHECGSFLSPIYLGTYYVNDIHVLFIPIHTIIALKLPQRTMRNVAKMKSYFLYY